MARTCHALALKNRPYSDFEWHCDLDDTKGLDVVAEYRHAEYAKVLRPWQICMKFIGFLIPNQPVQMPNGEDRPTLEIDNVSEQEMRAATGDFEDVFYANEEHHQKDDNDDYADDDDYDDNIDTYQKVVSII